MFSSFWLRWYRPLIFYQWLLPLCDTSGGVNYRYGISFTSFPCSSLTSSLFLAMLALYVFFFKFMFSFFNLDLFVSILVSTPYIYVYLYLQWWRYSPNWCRDYHLSLRSACLLWKSTFDTQPVVLMRGAYHLYQRKYLKATLLLLLLCKNNDS